MRFCHRCGKEWISDKQAPGVKETCPACNAYLHSCLNCRFHDKSKPNECQAPNTESVSDRGACNFCDEFEFADRAVPGREPDRATPAREVFGRLFGDVGGEDGLSEKGRDAFDKLFRG